MKVGKYTFIRFVFGLYLIWLALNNLYKIEENQKYVKNTIDNFEKGFSLEGLINSFYLSEYVTEKHIEQLRQYSFNYDHIKNSSEEIIYLMNISLLIGGALCSLGYSIAFSFVFIGILLNIIFIHNIYFFRDEKMKVNVLKMVSLLGGIFQIV